MGLMVNVTFGWMFLPPNESNSVSIGEAQKAAAPSNRTNNLGWFGEKKIVFTAGCFGGGSFK